MPSKGAWNRICLRKMLESFTYSSPQIQPTPPPLPTPGFFTTFLPPPLRPTATASLRLFGVFPRSLEALHPRPSSQAEARACAESGKAVLVRRERLGKGGGERREGGKERTAENLERLREGGRGEKGWGGVGKEGWVGTEERQ